MIGLNSVYKQHKLVYLDTNVISNICKKGDLINKFIANYPIDEKYLLCFSTYTLFEIARNEILYKDFKGFYSIYPSIIVISSAIPIIANVYVVEIETQIIGNNLPSC